MSQPSKASPRDKAEMFISLGQDEALKSLLAGDRCVLALQRKKGRMLEHLCKEKPKLLAVVMEAKARAEKGSPQ
jgi:hypothetical protein